MCKVNDRLNEKYKEMLFLHSFSKPTEIPTGDGS